MAKKKATKKAAKRNPPLKVNMSFEELLKMAATTPRKEHKKGKK